MTPNKLLAATTLLISTLLSISANAADAPAPGTYQIDPTHSKVGFEVQHLVISTVEGKFKSFSGTLEVGKGLSSSKLHAEADIASVDTGVDKRDAHLKSPDFFDADKFPKMTFDSTSVSGPASHLKIKGNLTIKGVTREVAFDGVYKGSAPDGYGNIKAVFDAKTKINRKDFGLNWGAVVEKAPVVGDIVTIDLKIEAATPAPKTASN